MYNTRSHTVSRALIVHELYVSLSCFFDKGGYGNYQMRPFTRSGLAFLFIIQMRVGTTSATALNGLVN